MNFLQERGSIRMIRDAHFKWLLLIYKISRLQKGSNNIFNLFYWNVNSSTHIVLDVNKGLLIKYDSKVDIDIVLMKAGSNLMGNVQALRPVLLEATRLRWNLDYIFSGLYSRLIADYFLWLFFYFYFRAMVIYYYYHYYF